MSITNSLDQSITEFPEKNIRYLAHQLAMNHFNVSAYDLYSDLAKSHGMDRDKMFQEVFDMKLSKGKYVDIDQVTGDRINTPYKESRNILIIGAGASQNAFTDLLLAKDAQEEILESIIVADGITKEVEGKVLKIDTPISLRYFLEFYENWKRGNDKEKGRLLKVTSGIKNEDLNQYLTEQLLNQKSYLYGLGEKYYKRTKWSR